MRTGSILLMIALSLGVTLVGLPVAIVVLWNALCVPMGAPQIGFCEGFALAIVVQLLTGRIAVEYKG